METMGTLIIIQLSFGTGLDPHQREVFGPALAPILVGLSAALVLFSTAFALNGYSGVSGNPSRCLGLLSAADNLTYHWVQWVGPITAAIINALFYKAIPISE